MRRPDRAHATGFPALMLRALASASTIPAGRPGLSSATSRTTYSPSAAQSKVIVPPSDVASTADPDSHRLRLVEMSARVGELAEFRRSATSGRPRRLSRSDELVLQIMQDVGDRSAERSRDRFESTLQSCKLCSRLHGAPGREHTLETVISLADAHPRTNLAHTLMRNRACSREILSGLKRSTPSTMSTVTSFASVVSAFAILSSRSSSPAVRSSDGTSPVT